MARLLPAILSLGLLALVLGSEAKAQTAAHYAGEQSREIKALSAKEIDDLTEGRGRGLAKAAELNRYPGPSHALDMAEQLHLTDPQREGLKLSMVGMASRAKVLGAEILAAERELDTAFANRSIDAFVLSETTLKIGAKQAQLRAVHLQAHLETAALLSPGQIARYDELRGYGSVSPAPAPETTHGGHGATRH
jgi:hypothetical protein